MKLQAQIGDTLYPVELVRNGDEVVAKIDDREYMLEVSAPEAGILLFKENGKIHEFFVSPEESDGSTMVVSSSRGDVHIKLTDPKQLRGSASVSGAGDGLVEIKTLMPGKVVRLLTQPGDQVEKGDAVLVVEAMKMQNDLKSPRAGIVKEIRVGEGTTVGAGDVLAVIE